MTADPLDYEFLTEWSRARQAAAYERQWRGEKCARCSHGWHGFPCTATEPLCHCPTAFEGAA